MPFNKVKTCETYCSKILWLRPAQNILNACLDTSERSVCARYVFSLIRCVWLSCDPKIRVCQGARNACIADLFYLQCVRSCYTLAAFPLFFKVKEKWLLLVLSLTHAKDFMLSVEHVFCVFTGGSDSDILALIRSLHFWAVFLAEKLGYFGYVQCIKIYPCKRFSGLFRAYESSP